MHELWVSILKNHKVVSLKLPVNNKIIFSSSSEAKEVIK